MSYEYLEDIATADIAFEARGKTIAEAFGNAAKATFNIITDIKNIKRETEKSLILETEDLESLLFEWIDNLLFYWDSENLVFSVFDIGIEKTENGYKLKAIVKGEKFDPGKHTVKQNVKSPTYHLMKIRQEKGEWKLRMVIDI